jgi:hypothetical protein
MCVRGLKIVRLSVRSTLSKTLQINWCAHTGRCEGLFFCSRRIHGGSNTGMNTKRGTRGREIAAAQDESLKRIRWTLSQCSLSGRQVIACEI